MTFNVCLDVKMVVFPMSLGKSFNKEDRFLMLIPTLLVMHHMTLNELIFFPAIA